MSEASVVQLLRALASTPASDAADAYRTAMREAYWERKDLAVGLAIGWAAVDRCFTDSAARGTDGAGKHLHLADAKGFLYDIASFTWPGWDEPGIAITTDQARLGLDAAVWNLELAVELDKDDLPMSRAHWMLGAHLLTGGDAAAAREQLDAAAECARRAGSPADEASARALIALADIARGDERGETQLHTTLELLEGLDDGPMFVDQITTVRRVLSV